MKALIFKEWRENLKWVPLPGLAIFLVFLIDKPDEPMPDVTGSFFFCLTGVLFGTALGFVQIFFDGHGDKRSLLLHRPLSPSRIFLAKALAGVVLYVVALGVPFVCLESWYAAPGKMPAPYYWRTSLPWLADILSGLVYYFAGMITAQREARWYGSRGLALAAAFLCSYLVWTLTEFGQAFVAIGIIGSLVAVAAWGSFLVGGAYAPQPRVARIALGMTFLGGLFIVGMLAKRTSGAWFDSGIEWESIVDRQGRVLIAPFHEGQGAIGPWTDLDGREPPDLNGKPVDSRITAVYDVMETPLDWSYRNSGRFYVPCRNDSTPSQEKWYYDQSKRRLFGYDRIFHQELGSFGPDGFAPAGHQPGQSFQGELCYRNTRWLARRVEYLAFPGAVYTIDFARRKIRMFFISPVGETVTCADSWSDELDRKRRLIAVATDKSFHLLSNENAPVVSVPRVHREKPGGIVLVGLLEKPERFLVWYTSWTSFLEPEELTSMPTYLLEYDAAGRELAHRTVPPPPFLMASYAAASFGLVTPMTEAAFLVGASRHLRSKVRSEGSSKKPVLLSDLENIRYYIPATSRYKGTPGGLISGYVALILLSAAACALGCFRLARRYAFSPAHRLGWALMGFCFGWVGLVLMLVLQEWPARIACPKCRKLRVVTRDTCEHCGALHASPAPDGTEIFESGAIVPHVALTAS